MFVCDGALPNASPGRNRPLQPRPSDVLGYCGLHAPSEWPSHQSAKMGLKEIEMSRVAFIALGVLLATLTMGCADDRHSQRRIALRRQHFQDTVQDFERREATGPGRVERAQRAVEEWWRRDEAEFAAGVEQVGDYVW